MMPKEAIVEAMGGVVQQLRVLVAQAGTATVCVRHEGSMLACLDALAANGDDTALTHHVESVVAAMEHFAETQGTRDVLVARGRMEMLIRILNIPNTWDKRVTAALLKAGVS